MNASNKDDFAQSAKERLAQAGKTKDESKRLGWGATMGAAILFAALLLALIDYWLVLPLGARLAGSGALAALVLLGIYRLIRFYRQPTSLKEAALDTEAERPDLGCEVSTAAEYLTGERSATHEYEPELVAALQSKVADELRAAPVPGRKGLLVPLWLFAGALAGLLLLAAFTPAGVTALTRTALPFVDKHYTRVEVKPGNIEIPVGRDLDITNIFSGRLPNDARFHWLEAGSNDWRSVALNSSTNGVYVHSLRSVPADLKYRATGSDATSDVYEIKTYVPPEVKAFSVKIDYPDYSRHKPTVQQTPDINVLRASSATVQITPNVKLSKATLRFSAASNVELTGDGENRWAANFKITKDTDYWIELVDEKGHKGINEKPFHIKAMSDTPPRVEMIEPGKDIRAAATNTVPMRISVADDFGVGEIKVVYHVLGGAEQNILARREGETNGEVTATAELRLESLGLKEYQVVAYHAEAKDDNTLDGPGVGRSRVYFIEITNEETGDSKTKAKGEKANLLAIQKQIISDTAALAAAAPADKFNQLAEREKVAREFGQMYLSAMSSNSAPAAAVAEMEAALKDMQQAGSQLGKRKRSDALPPEESALAHLYQALKQMPALKNLPVKPELAKEKLPQSDRLAAALEAIKKKKKEEPDDKQIEAALKEARDLSRAQASVNAALRNDDAADQGENEGDGQAANESAKKKNEKSQARPGNKNQQEAKSKSANQAQGQGQGKGEGQAQGEDKNDQPKDQKDQAKQQAKNQKGANNPGQGQGDGKGNKGDEPQSPKQQGEEQSDQDSDQQEPEQLAEKQDELSKEAAALAEMLQRLASRNTRVGQHAGQKAGQAAKNMAAAAQSMKQGNFGAAGVNGLQGEAELGEVISQLEKVVAGRVERADVANEDFPKEYEALISEYLKKLSHAE
ncbi:MAG: hypothetical protein HY043_18690 [Verrucomicrobia bacterium]|nr:hypothetical protein [Verrucomicrobiota bacterium]